MRTRKARYGRIGSVSSGTMRPEDLIPAFLDCVEGIRLSREDRAAAKKLRVEYEACQGDGETSCEVLGHEGMCSEAADVIVNDLFDLLDRYAAPYCYFGSIEGDGADYGFWPAHDAIQEAVREGEEISSGRNGDSEHWIDEGWYRLVVNDHGNMTLLYRNGREVWSIV